MYFDPANTMSCFVQTQQGNLQRRTLSHHLANNARQTMDLSAHWRQMGSRCSDSGILVGDDDGALAFLDTTHLQTQSQWFARRANPWHVLDVCNSGDKVVALDDLHTLHAFDLANQRVMTQQRGTLTQSTIALSASGQWLVMACIHPKGGDVRVWRWDEGLQLQTRALDRRHITGPTATLKRKGQLKLCIDPQDRYLAIYESVLPHQTTSEGWRGCVHVYDLPGARLLFSAHVDGQITGDLSPMDDVLIYPQFGSPGALWFHPSQPILYCGTTRGTILCIDPRDGALLQTHNIATTMPIKALCADDTHTLWAMTTSDQILMVRQTMPTS